MGQAFCSFNAEEDEDVTERARPKTLADLDSAEQATRGLLASGSACYLVYEVFNNGTLFAIWSKVQIWGAIAMFRSAVAVPAFKFTSNKGRTELKRKCGGVNKKLFYEGCCEFVKLARKNRGTFKIVNCKEADFIFLRGNKIESLSREDFPLDTDGTTAVAVIPKNSNVFRGIKIMPKLRFANMGSQRGYSLIF